MRRMIGGMNRVEMIIPNKIFFPRNSIRASAYAAIDAVMRTSAVLARPATILLRNHLRAGDWELELSIVEGPSVENCFGIQLRGSWVVSALGLSEVESIHRRGATKMRVRRISSAYVRSFFANSP